jgi:hypothetical protein
MNSPGDERKPLPVFESYPAWMVSLSVGLNLSIYALASVLMARLGWEFLAAYLLFLACLEVNLLTKSCVYCAYYGKVCFSGKGKVAAWLFRRGDPSRFASREVTWLALLPDLLVTLMPLGAGLLLLIREIDWMVLLLMIGLIILAFPGTGLVRSQLACCHCRQRELGCPAEQLFRAREGVEPTHPA